MYKPSQPIFTEHRRQRLALWALTVLGWLMGVLLGQRELSVRQLNQRFHHILLDDLTRVTIALVAGRALQFAKVRIRPGLSHWKHGRHLRPAGFMRSFLGARFRRQLKHRDLKTRIAQLIDVLRDLDAHARRLAARLRKMRRIWRIARPIAPATFLLGAPAPLPALADSS